jgi:hypothetical protein
VHACIYCKAVCLTYVQKDGGRGCCFCVAGVWCMVAMRSPSQSTGSSLSCSSRCWTLSTCFSCSPSACGSLMTTCITHWQYWPCLCLVSWWQSCRLGKWVPLCICTCVSWGYSVLLSPHHKSRTVFLEVARKLDFYRRVLQYKSHHGRAVLLQVHSNTV